MYWKEALLAKSREMGIEPDEKSEVSPNEDEVADVLKPHIHAPLNVIKEKKGRKGKTAVIIEGFECGDEQLKQIASTLKTTLGVGGSARGGEILIQGDCRERVCEVLRQMGFRVKG